jgi:hypothetical protein
MMCMTEYSSRVYWEISELAFNNKVISSYKSSRYKNEELNLWPERCNTA